MYTLGNMLHLLTVYFCTIFFLNVVPFYEEICLHLADTKHFQFDSIMLKKANKNPKFRSCSIYTTLWSKMLWNVKLLSVLVFFTINISMTRALNCMFSVQFSCCESVIRVWTACSTSPYVLNATASWSDYTCSLIHHKYLVEKVWKTLYKSMQTTGFVSFLFVGVYGKKVAM